MDSIGLEYMQLEATITCYKAALVAAQVKLTELRDKISEARGETLPPNNIIYLDEYRNKKKLKSV